MSYYCYPLRRWGGALLAWYENRGTGRCFSFPIMMPVPKSSPLPKPPVGALTHAVSNDGDLNGSKPLTYSTSEVVSTLRGSAPYITLTWLPLPVFPVFASLQDTLLASSGLFRVYTLDDLGNVHLPSLESPSAAPPLQPLVKSLRR